MKAHKKIGMLSLALLITGSVDSIRNMPTTALFGPQLIFFAVLGALFFLIPIGLVSAELVTTKDLKSGVYQWVKVALGKRAAFFAIWLQWINTLVWYPTILSFIAGTAAYLINPALAQNKWYLVAVILIVFWSLTGVNLKGIKVATTVASVCTLLGVVIPMLLIISLGLVWVAKGFPLQIHFAHTTVLPTFNDVNSWISLTAIITSFLGMELAAVHAKEVENPQKNFPRSLCFSVFFIMATMILGSLVIALVLPQKSIHLVDGTMQVFTQFFNAYHMDWLLPFLVGALVVGSIGSMINWVISPAQGLLQAAEDAFLPTFFRKINQNGVASHLILIQAVLVTVMCLAFVLMPSVNGSYWLLMDLSTQLYVIMYVVMFIAAWKFKWENPNRAATFKIWGGKIGMVITALFGLMGCLVTFVIGFVPPGDINVGSALHFIAIFSMGLVIMILPVFAFYPYEKRNRLMSGLATSIQVSRELERTQNA
ncbi:MAG: transporter [Coxiella sp. RIFCSPHIGHO2_12_FULL_42_15]|nr:MAG: transporter [Coxiella sp. RIFCSPHIGHO2_12_FULL_42_15]